MIFCDTHAHLYAEEFDADRDLVIHRALDAGIKYLFLPAIDQLYFQRMLDLVSRYPENCFPMIGLHPTSVKGDYLEELRMVREKVNDPEYHFYAIGEIGIDHYWSTTFSVQQEDAFRQQVDLSIIANLPLIIHTRNSFDLTIGILEEYKNKVRGIFHCFGGSVAQAERAIDLGFKLGIGGILTYKNSGLQKVVEATDLKHMVLETDAPYLTPVPHRGQRNESCYIPYIAAKIAEIKNLPLETVADITTQSSLDLFRIKND